MTGWIDNTDRSEKIQTNILLTVAAVRGDFFHFYASI